MIMEVKEILMEYYKTIELKNNIIYINQINGNQITLPKTLKVTNRDLKRIFKKNQFDKPVPLISEFDKKLFRTIFISLHTSSQCNMQCKYCFMKNREETNLDFEESKRFIDYIVKSFPHAGKYIVDPTGSGEPLLRMDLILKIGEYCHTKSNEINKEVLPMLVSNGILLTKDNVEKLQHVGYIFGISIDGYRKSHDLNRVDKRGEGTYKKIIKNVKNIKHKHYLGAAVTLTGHDMNLLKAYRTLYKNFRTISIKPVRSFENGIEGLSISNIEEVKEQYNKLFEFILNKTINGKLDYLSVLINGDDYFGKFLLRVVLNQKVFTRCDAGLGRFSLTPDRKIIACPGSVGIKEMELGDLDNGIKPEKVQKLWETLTNRQNCEDCEARFVCGGECLVVSYYKSKKITETDEIMCELKRHLFRLAVIFRAELLLKSERLFDIVYDGCMIKAQRFDEDRDLKNVLSKLDNKYTYLELKKIKDDSNDEYLRIKRGLR
jgi:uncharacterized protein